MFEIGVATAKEPEKCSAAWLNSEVATAVMVTFEILLEFGIGSGAFFRVLEWIRIPIEIRADFLAEFFKIEIRNIADEAMRGKDHEAFGMCVDECGHREFMRGHRLFGPLARAALVPVGKSCFVAVMAISNDEFLVGHFLPHTLDESFIRYGPKAMGDAELVV